MMKLIVISCLVAATVALSPNYGNYKSFQQQPQQYSRTPVSSGSQVPIVSQSNELSPDGSYTYSYQTGDGQSQQAQGYLKNAGVKDAEAEVAQGSYSYTAPDGTPITVTWVADENGFRAEGAHLPTPPPIPEAIQRSLQLISQTQNIAQPARYQPQYQSNQFNQRNRYNF